MKREKISVLYDELIDEISECILDYEVKRISKNKYVQKM